jgi:hypothetical protein
MTFLIAFRLADLAADWAFRAVAGGVGLPANLTDNRFVVGGTGAAGRV